MRKMKTTLLLLAFTLLPRLIMAQDPGEPCDDADPFDNYCPLDSWVYLLALAPLAITLVALYFRGEAVKQMEEKKAELFMEEHYYEPSEGHDLAA